MRGSDGASARRRALSSGRGRALAVRGIGLAGAGLVAVASGCFDVRSYPGPAVCVSVDACDDGTPCTIDWCDDGTCRHDPLNQAGPSDGNACTKDVCQAGNETHTPTQAGSFCGNGPLATCDANGQCVGCATDANCGDDEDCLTYQCNSGTCEVVLSPEGTVCMTSGRCDGKGRCATCSDGMQDGTETDVDCGGDCGSGCAIGAHCDADADCVAGASCATGVCSSGGAGGGG
ncbi:MAG: hypothetical protein U0441_09920 [Polyangiaceae bacterium]